MAGDTDESMHAETPLSRLGERLSKGRAPVVVELLVIIGAIQLLLLISESLGGATLLGGAIGWGGLMLGVLLVWISLRARGLAWDALGLTRPRSWAMTIALGVVVAVVTLLAVGTLMQVVIVPLLKEAPDTSRFAVLRGNPIALALGLFSVWTAAAFGEEIVARGYMLGRLAGLLSGSRGAWLAAVIVGAALFGAMHFYQGWAGVAVTGSVGLVFGLVYVFCGKNLWVLIFAHGLIDTLSFIQIYLS